MQVLFQLSYSPTEARSLAEAARPRSADPRRRSMAAPVRTCHHRAHDRIRPAAARRDRRSTGPAAPGRPADVGVLGDRILAVGDLSAVADERGRDRAGRHRPGRGARVHRSARPLRRLRSSSTGPSPATSTRATRPSCRATAATRWRRSPTLGRELVELPLRPNGLVARWRTFARVPRPRRRAAARPERRVPRRPRDGPRVRHWRRRRDRPPTTNSRPWSARSRPRWMPARSASRPG